MTIRLCSRSGRSAPRWSWRARYPQIQVVAVRDLYRVGMCVLATKVDQAPDEEVRIAHIVEGE